MGTELVADLLQKFNHGDYAAAEEVFRAYEPYLRMIIRRQLSGDLRSKFDSIDVVQSVWTDVLRGLRDGKWAFPTPDHLHAFLLKMTRNRFLDRVRKYHRLRGREEPLADEEDDEQLLAQSEERPSEVACAEELWARMLTLCSPAHRDVLLLKRQGLSLAEIAAQTGMHQSSIRRILYDLARRLASQRNTGTSFGTS